MTALKIDFHTHIFPNKMPDLRSKFSGERWPYLEMIDDEKANIMVNGKVFRTIFQDAWNPLRRIEKMDSEGIDKEVISATPITFCYWAPPEGAAEMARIQNEYIADVVRSYPDRFIGLGSVPFQDVDLAIKEMDYSIHQLQLSGIQLGSSVNGANISEEEYYPFFEMAEKWNVPLFIHPYDMIGKERTTNFNSSYTVGMPIELALSVANLLFSGVMEQFPNLKICLAHGGGALPFILGRMDQGWHTWSDKQKTPHPPSHYAKMLYYDALVYSKENLQYLIDTFGHERLMMGTDAPFAIKESPRGKAILELDSLSSEQKDDLFGNNALRFLNIT